MQRCWPRAPAESRGIGGCSRSFASNYVLVSVTLVFLPFTIASIFEPSGVLTFYPLVRTTRYHIVVQQYRASHDVASIEFQYRFPTSDVLWVGKGALQSSKREGDREPSPPCSIYGRLFLHFFAQSNPQKACPRNGVMHEKVSLGGLVHRINNKNCSYSSFRYGTVPRATFHYNFILRGTEVARKKLGKKNAGYPGTRVPGIKNGYPGTQASNWHYPVGRVGSGLRNLAGTRFGRVPAGSYL